ncbi:Cat-1 [Aphelenchoides fujianensis]|nr:Cat-1 [Aphelenchoides fujianensis]
MGLLDDFITKYRANRKVLLLIVYVALFLDNMLLTTVVPIIPEYLLRISHPNQTDELLHDKIPELHKGTRGRRDLDWDDDDWDNTWDNPMPAPSPTAAKMPSWTNRVHSGTFEQKSKQRPQSAARGPGGSQRSRMKPAYTTTTPAFEEDDDEDYDRDKYVAEVKQRRHETLSEENVHVGLMFGSKALIQLIANPMIGPWTNKIGYTIPMFTGFVIMFLSTLLFAFGASYSTLWMARALQGIGSACTSTSGMGMLAQAYPDDAERGSAMGIALGGLALGVLVGPPYGGVLYEWAGKELPFVLLALLALLDGTLQFLVLQPRVDRGEPEGAGLKQLAKDPYIIVAAGSITIGNLGIAMLEPSLPLWMMESWGASSIERGAAFLPASISYLIGTNIFGPLAHRIGRWLSGFIGLVIIGFCLLAIPSAGSVGGLIIPNFFMGFSIGMIDASMFPMMGYIVDLRHVGVYGSIYAIADAAFCFAFALGPFFSGPLVRTVGFPAMMYLIALVNFLYAPLMFFLRKLPDTLPEKPADANGNAAAPLQATIQNGSTTVIETINPAHYQSISGIADPTIAARTGPDYQYAWDD